MTDQLEPDGTWEGEDMDDAADAAWAKRMATSLSTSGGAIKQGWLEDYQKANHPPSEAVTELSEFLKGLDQKGGPGSGHWGHAGRPGKRGGSLPANVAVSIRTGRTAADRQAQAAGVVEPDGPLTAEGVIAKLSTMRKRQKQELDAAFEAKQKIYAEYLDIAEQRGRTSDEDAKKRLSKQRQAKWEEYIDADDAYLALSDKMKEEQRELVSVDNPSQVTVKMPFRAGRKKRVMEGVEAFRKLVGVDTMDNHTVKFINKKKGRSCCGHRTIELTTDAGASTTLHEMGHAWEHTDRDVAMAARAFLGIRTAGERSRRLKDLLPGDGYDADEMAKPDNFTHPYMGKIYSSRVGGRPTEIISMGLQEMWADPAGFAAADPEYFALIYNLCRGTAWKE